MNRITKTGIVFAAALASGLVVAGPFGGGRGEGDCSMGPHFAMHRGFTDNSGRMLERMSACLDLSEDQRQSVSAIFEEVGPRRQALRDAMQENRRALRELAMNADADPAAVRELADNAGATLSEQIVLRNEVKTRIYALLDEQQREQWRSRQASRFERMDKLHRPF